jgi:nitroreductase
MDFFSVIEKRQSIRAFRSDIPVKEESLKRILRAARLAPTAANKQPYKLVVIKNPKRMEFIKQKAVHQAPLAIAIFIDESQAWTRSFDKKNFAFVDGAIIFEHLILAATAEGLGSVWIANIDPYLMKRHLQLPTNYRFLALSPLGYPAEQPKKTSRKPEDEVVFYDS